MDYKIRGNDHSGGWFENGLTRPRHAGLETCETAQRGKAATKSKKSEDDDEDEDEKENLRKLR